jgi:glycerol-3-phosphate O-acyltransferase
VVFVPVALNYDRVMEDRNLIEAQANGARAFRFSLRPIWRYLRRQTWLRLTGKFHRYGYAAVCFGDPLSLTEFLGCPRPDQPGGIGWGTHGAHRPGHARDAGAAGLPCARQRCDSRAELEQSVAARIEAARDRGATIHIPRDDLTYTVEAGLRALMERRLLNIGPEGGLELSEAGTRMAEFYAASVAHLLDGEVDAPHTGAEDPPQRQVAAT